MKQIEPFNSFLTKVLVIVALFVAALLFVTHVFGDHYPQYKNYVNDFANVISNDTEKKLNAKLKEYDDKTSNQIAVATITSLEGEEIENYSIHLAEQWAPGTKEKDNGIIMLFAMNDRKMRIEVGQGLEGDVTDIESKHILDDIIRPEFKSENYDAGITKGIDAVILSIATDSAALAQTNDEVGFTFIAIILIVILLITVLVIIAESPYTPIGGQGDWGITSTYHSTGGSFFSSGNGDSDSDGPSFGGGGFSGGGSSSSW